MKTIPIAKLSPTHTLTSQVLNVMLFRSSAAALDVISRAKFTFGVTQGRQVALTKHGGKGPEEDEAVTS